MYRRTYVDRGCTIELDISNQVLSLSAPPKYTEFGRPKDLHNTLASVQSGSFVSASALLMKAKQFDDGLYAAVELLAQEGTSDFLGKKAFLQAISESLTATPNQSESVVAHILAASKLGGSKSSIAETYAQLVSKAVNNFCSNQWKSKPISFYTWSESLSQIFQQDRLLQEPLPAQGVKGLIDTMRACPKLRSAYVDILDLTAKMTNPFTTRSLSSFVLASGEGYPERDLPLFPASVSPEISLMDKLFSGGKPIPENFSLIEEIIRQLRQGSFSLRPQPDSGWYDYALWAIEPLAVPNSSALPESSRVRLEKSYADCLLDLFRGAYALTRETHIKQLSGGSYGSGGSFPLSLFVSPKLSVEPLPSVYLRRAISYRFIAEVLATAFGESALEATFRQVQDGQVNKSLRQELDQMQAIFVGAHLVACEELAMEPFLAGETKDSLEPPTKQELSAKEIFKQWAATISSDPDLSRDCRCMVPVFYDQERHQMKVWIFLGWRQREISVDFHNTPTVLSVDSSAWKGWNMMSGLAGSDPPVKFCGKNITVAYPATAEIYVSQLMNRDEFVAHCDRYKTEKELLDSFQSVSV